MTPRVAPPTPASFTSRLRSPAVAAREGGASGAVEPDAGAAGAARPVLSVPSPGGAVFTQAMA